MALTQAERSRRYRERHPEYRVSERERRRRAHAERRAADPEYRADERDRIRDYRAKHPAQDYITNLRSRRRREATRRREYE